VTTTTMVTSTIIYVLLGAGGGTWLWVNGARFDGHSTITSRGVRFYGLALCLVIVLLGVTSLALSAAGDG
jgi:hypothetical protein